MRIAGLVLIGVGFLSGSLAAIYEPDSVHLLWFGVSVALGVAGVVLVQVATRRHATDESRVDANFQVLTQTLGRVVDNLAELNRDKASVHVYNLPEHLDETFHEDLTTFAAARETIAHVWGSQSYAEVMSPFAAGERYLNRVWSCAADGYVDEAHTYLDRAEEQLRAALSTLDELRA